MAHRYWIVQFLGSLSGSNLVLGEMQFRTTVGVPLIPSGGAPVANANQGGLVIANLFDGSAATIWATSGNTFAYGGYIYAVGIDVLELALASGAGNLNHAPAGFIVFSSPDGADFVERLRVTGLTLADWGVVGSTITWLIPLGTTDAEVSAVAAHSVPGTPDDTEAVADVVMHTAVGSSPSESWVSTVSAHTILSGRAARIAVDSLVMHTVIGPPLPYTPSGEEGPDPEILPPEDCNDTGNPACCVPDLNRVIEARVGVLKDHHDLVVAIQYLQDRHNVLVREFNKLALVTRPNPPSV
jgi:hypothetical protein